MKKVLKLTSLLLIALCGLAGCSNKEFNPESDIKLYTRDTTSLVPDVVSLV